MTATGTPTITLNNSALNVSAAPVVGFPGHQLPNFYDFVSDLEGGDLDYTRFGYWYRFQVAGGMEQAGAWTAGFVTPANDIPTQGTAAYSGHATGLYNDAGACNCGDQFVSTFTGDVDLTVNFTNQSLNGSITNILLTPISGTAGPMNDIGFVASIDRTSNLFAGTTSVTSQPGGDWAFGPSASGLINGRFYGPGAAEVGAVFSLTEGLKRLIGSFGASRTP